MSLTYVEVIPNAFQRPPKVPQIPVDHTLITDPVGGQPSAAARDPPPDDGRSDAVSPPVGSEKLIAASSPSEHALLGAATI
ncbi:MULTISPECIES: hypothetical protein [Halorubrum]|uniref:hypothetical protein n=1 Tax=Halorubrum TaxID=56688 RepID=UPI00118197A3|nr:hypothetical protein [Halorubrum persicum]